VNWKQTIKRLWSGAGLGALLVVAVGLALLLVDCRPAVFLAHLSYDMPFRHRPKAPPPEEVVLVYLDDESFRSLGQPYVGPWDRGLYARLLERLTAEKARAVSFDILFSDPNVQYPEGDARFAQAIKANGRVVLAGDYEPAAGGGWTLIRGVPAFYDAAAGCGMTQMTPDQDFVVRRHFHVPEDRDYDLYSSLSWELARVSGAKIAQEPQQRYAERWINYYGPPGTIPNISFQLALQTNDLICPVGFFSNKIVLVGSSLKTLSANERKDELRTPYTKDSFCPAVDIHATQLLNLLRGDWLTRTRLSTEIVLVTLAGIFFGYGLSLFRPLPAMLMAVGGGLLVAMIAQFFFTQARLWFPWMIVVAVQIPVALLWSVVCNSVRLYVQNRLYEQSLRMYLPPNLVKKFAHNRELLKPGAEKHLLTLLFSDIADFSSLSEGMDPDELAGLMNAYFQAAVGECIHKTDGTVVKYIGDAIFAFWNAPELQADHAFRACEAALRFLELNGREIRGRRLRTRLGLHTGIANVGNFGSEERVDYTALGENVNVASRLEGLNKYFGTECLISGQTKAAIGDRLVTRPLGSVRLKGFASLVEVHELLGWPERVMEGRKMREVFAQALNNYEQRNLEFAEIGFRQVLEMSPNDGPAQFFLKQIQEKYEGDPSDEWATFTVLKEK
jgi:adenylate cyclase